MHFITAVFIGGHITYKLLPPTRSFGQHVKQKGLNTSSDYTSTLSRMLGQSLGSGLHFCEASPFSREMCIWPFVPAGFIQENPWLPWSQKLAYLVVNYLARRFLVLNLVFCKVPFLILHRDKLVLRPKLFSCYLSFFFLV